MLYLILHKVRGEPAFDIAEPIRSQFLNEDIWIIPTSGHRCYPYKKWCLEDLADISDINADGHHEMPASLDHTVPGDWPDHYQMAKPLRLVPQQQVTIEDLLI